MRWFKSENSCRLFRNILFISKKDSIFRVLLLYSLFLVLGNCKEDSVVDSKNEIQAIRSKDSIELATLTWLPYVGEELPENGYVYKLVKESYSAVGLSVNIKFYPFARILKLAEKGEIDGYFPEYFTPDYENIFYFSEAYKGGEVGFMLNTDSNIEITTFPNMQDFRDLEKYKFGVVRGYINTKAFDSASYLHKEETGSDLLNIKKLYFKRIDSIFIDVNVANYILSKQMSRFPNAKEKLQFMEPPIENKLLHTCFSVKSPNSIYKLQKFNEGLKILRKKGRLEKILEESHFEKGRYRGKE